MENVKAYFGQPKQYQGADRFNDNDLTEWHIISTDQPDHYGDVMVYEGMELPPSGKGIALLNHDPEYTGGLPLGKVLDYQVISDGQTKQLWQHTQYLKELPDNIGVLTYNARKAGAFVDSSIQFRPKKYEPIDGGGLRFLEWQLVEAGPVLIGANWHTGAMKAEGEAVFKDLMTALKKHDPKVAELQKKIDELTKRLEALEPVKYKYVMPDNGSVSR